MGYLLHAAGLSGRPEEQLYEAARRLCPGPREESHGDWLQRDAPRVDQLQRGGLWQMQWRLGRRHWSGHLSVHPRRGECAAGSWAGAHWSGVHPILRYVCLSPPIALRLHRSSLPSFPRCPCLTCSIKIVQVGISEVVYSQGYSMDTQVTAAPSSLDPPRSPPFLTDDIVDRSGPHRRGC